MRRACFLRFQRSRPAKVVQRKLGGKHVSHGCALCNRLRGSRDVPNLKHASAWHCVITKGSHEFHETLPTLPACCIMEASYSVWRLFLTLEDLWQADKCPAPRFHWHLRGAVGLKSCCFGGSRRRSSPHGACPPLLSRCCLGVVRRRCCLWMLVNCCRSLVVFLLLLLLAAGCLLLVVVGVASAAAAVSCLIDWLVHCLID